MKALCIICYGAAQILSNICRKETQLGPVTALSGVVPGVFAIKGAQCNALAFMSLLACQLVLIQ